MGISSFNFKHNYQVVLVTLLFFLIGIQICILAGSCSDGILYCYGGEGGWGGELDGKPVYIQERNPHGGWGGELDGRCVNTTHRSNPEYVRPTYCPNIAELEGDSTHQSSGDTPRYRPYRMGVNTENRHVDTSHTGKHGIDWGMLPEDSSNLEGDNLSSVATEARNKYCDNLWDEVLANKSNVNTKKGVFNKIKSKLESWDSKLKSTPEESLREGRKSNILESNLSRIRRQKILNERDRRDRMYGRK